MEKPFRTLRKISADITYIQGLVFDCELALEGLLEPDPEWTKGDRQEVRRRAKITLQKLRGKAD